MAFTITISDLPDLGRGAAFLGAGGGGNPYIGRLMVELAMRETGRDLELLDVDDLEDGALVIPTAMMGAPTVIVEKLPQGSEALPLAARARTAHWQESHCDHAGGSRRRELDDPTYGRDSGRVSRWSTATGSGRHSPNFSTKRSTFTVFSGTPMALTDEHLDYAVVETHDNFEMEWFARGLTVRMGGVSYIAMYPMDGATTKRTAIRGTIQLGLRIGKTIREARAQHCSPTDALIAMFATTNYHHADVVFQGKVTEVFRRTIEGFVRGSVQLLELSTEPRTMQIDFQNENLLASIGDDVLVMVPDLICVLDAETAEPITTEELRYGQRVTVMAVSVPDIMRTPEALAVWGPRHFGYDLEYKPVEQVMRKILDCREMKHQADTDKSLTTQTCRPPSSFS